MKGEKEEQTKTLGIYKMLHDMHDQQYLSPLHSVEELRPKFKKNKNDTDLKKVLYWVGLAVSGVLLVVYFIAMYFTYFDDPRDFNKMVSNRGWKTSSSVNLERQRIRDLKARQQSEAERYAAPTKTTVYRDAQVRRKRVDGKND